MKAYGIIPARYASSRFEGKPLALIHNKPMFLHVYERACKANLECVYLATDDLRIQKEAQKYNVPCIMTRDDHNSGSDRVFEAASTLNLDANAIIVNIQGDEPLLEPQMLNQLIEPFKDEQVQVSTLANVLHKVNDKERFLSPNTVKIVLDNMGKALYFSRSPIPFSRDTETNEEELRFYSHIGLYAFRYKTLETFTKLPASSLENIEKLEQLRLLENNINIQVVGTTFTSLGVDSKEDLEKVVQIMLENQ